MKHATTRSIVSCLLCMVLVHTACKQETKWIPQYNDYNIHWQTTPEAGYELNHVYMDTAGNAWAISVAGIIRYRAKGGDWVTEELPVKGVLLFCIDGRGDEVWVGGEDGTILYKKKGHPWTLQQQPSGLVDLRAIHVSEHDVYLVGSWGVILHKKGNGEWIKEHTANDPMDLVRIKGSPDDLYVIGNPHIILHKTKGAGWIKEKCPPVKPNLINLFVSNNDAYICGDSGMILHKTGKQPWVIEKTPLDHVMVFALYGWDNQVWAATLSGSIFHKTGQGPWQVQQQYDSMYFSALYGKQHDLWLAGSNGTIAHKHENDPWKQEPTGAKDAVLYALGGNGKEITGVGLYETILSRNEKGHWTKQNTLLPDVDLTGMYTQDDEIWISGRNGVILYKKGHTNWQQEPTGVKDFELKSGYRFGDEVWLIGKPGKILHKKGKGAWTVLAHDGGKAELYSIYGYRDELWLVGSNDMVLHKKSGGHQWKKDFTNKQFSFYTDIIGSGDDLWTVGERSILHKKLNDSTWQQQAIDPEAIAGIRDWHLHVIRKQGTDLWAAGSNGIILHKKPNQPWKREIVNESIVEFKQLEVNDGSVWAVGNADKKGIMVYKQGNNSWKKEEFPGKELGKIIFHKGVFVLTSTGYLYRQTDQTGFIEKRLTSELDHKVVSAAVIDTTLYLVTGHAITAITSGEKLYPALRQMRYFRDSWFNPDSLEIQVNIQSPPKGRGKDLRAVNMAMFAKPYNETQDEAADFIPVKARYRILDTSGNNMTISGRFELLQDFHIIPSSDVANKLAVRLYVNSNSAGMLETFLLKDDKGNPYITIYPIHIQLTTWQKIVLGIVCLYLLPYIICWYFFPLRFLQLHRSNFFAELAGLHAPVGSLLKMLNNILTLNGLPCSARVQNAWLGRYTERLIVDYLRSETVRQKNYYIPLPLCIDDRQHGEKIDKPDEKLLQKIFKPKQSIVQIIGQGGAGKTTLAVAIGRWLLEQEQPGGKVSIPVIIESETTNLVKTIGDQFKAQLNLEYIPERLISNMLDTQRIVVIIDALSERSKETREYFETAVPANAMIITTRFKLPVQAKESTELYLSPLNSKNLMHFITAELQHRTNHPVKTWRQQIAFAGKIVQLFESNHLIAAITPILVKLIIDNALRHATENTHFETVISSIPKYIPQVYYQYLVRVQPAQMTAGNFLHDDQVVEVAEIMARLSLQKNFTPKDFREREARNIFLADPKYKDIDPIQRFIDNGIISRRQTGNFYLRFNLDTLAEYVGASHMYDEYQHDPEKLNELIQTVEQLGQEAAGFRQAFEQVIAYKQFRV